MFTFKSCGAPLALAAIALYWTSGAARAAETEATPLVDEVVVIAQRLNEARNSIQTQTGASTYVINEAAIDAAPAGDNSLLNQVVMQAPDVAQDSFGQYHVRGGPRTANHRVRRHLLSVDAYSLQRGFFAGLGITRRCRAAGWWVDAK